MPKLAKKASSASAKSDSQKKKPISKAAKDKTSKKTDTSKKPAVKAKRSAPTKQSKENNERTLDLCLLLDCTSSMHSWI